MRFALMVSLVTCLCVAWSAVGADKPLVVEVWPGRIPDESGNSGAEKFRMSPKLDRKQVEVTEPTKLLTNVTKPTLTIYRPAKDKDTGTAMLICPGGGYWDLYLQLEGEEVAAWLNSIGATGIILKYRVPRRPFIDAARVRKYWFLLSPVPAHAAGMRGGCQAEDSAGT